MATQALEPNATGFHLGMYRSCANYVKAARPAAEHKLAAHQIFALPDEDLTLICLAGELWLTRDGDIEDYILGPGHSFVVRRGDQVAVQALKPSRVRLITA
jgi:hypothetical protein